jgi:hypothetical protein
MLKVSHATVMVFLNCSSFGLVVWFEVAGRYPFGNGYILNKRARSLLGIGCLQKCNLHDKINLKFSFLLDIPFSFFAQAIAIHLLIFVCYGTDLRACSNYNGPFS